MNSLIALSDDYSYSQEQRPFRRPVARRARAIFFPGNNYKRHAFRNIFFGRVENWHLRPVRQVLREAAFQARDHLVAQSHVGKCPAHHHFMISAPRSVRIELSRLDAMPLQIFSCWTVLLDRARRRNVISSNAIAKDREYARISDVAHSTGARHHIVEVRRTLDVRGSLVPGISVSRWHLQSAPVFVSRKNVLIAVPEHRRRDLAFRLLHLPLRWPQVGQ